MLNTLATQVPAGALADLDGLYQRGRYVSSHALAVERHGPLQHWHGGTASLVFASRLAGNLGADRLGHALILRACRRAASDPEATPLDRAQAALFHAFRTLGRRGPLALRRFLKRPGVRNMFDRGADAETRADVLCLEARIAAAFHDTDTADARWSEAKALAANKAWIWTERASMLVSADCYPEALDAARESLRLSPWFRPAVQQAAHILSLLRRDEEAASLLEDALNPQKGGLESPSVAAQLAEIYAELLRPSDVLEALERFEALSPLKEESNRLWVASRRGEALLKLGDLPGSADACEPLIAANFFYGKTVPRLRDPERRNASRVDLAVPFVRQHERTCAPATLAALSHFWKRPADHQDIAREICYGGTFDHAERHWAESHGWTVREFRADWAGSVELLDAGIPFSVVTSGINSGHLQAIIGYDARRGTLVIRDPYQRNQTEGWAEEFFERFAFCGPRAMAIVPADDPAATDRLRAASLCESALYDGLYRMRRALHVHERAAARAALDELQAIDPAARLTFFGRRELAYYDANDIAALAAVEGLLDLFPKEGRLRLEKLQLLRRLARPFEARAWLEACVSDRAHTEPNLWRELARELMDDAREHPRARRLLARGLFYEPAESEHLRVLAQLLWSERDYIESGALLRLAATSAGVREDYWQQFFIASRHLRKTDDALRLLDARFRRLGDRSSEPGRTLYWALRERHEFTPAGTVLAEALRRRPADGDLLLFAATARARDGEHDDAARFLDQARGHAAPGAFSRAAAEVAELAGDSLKSLAHWRDVLLREPLDRGAHGAVARLLAATDPHGPSAAAEHLDAAVARFPHAVALHEMRITALIDEPGRGSAEHFAATAALLAVHQTHVWAHREKALAFEARRDLPAAFGVIDEAERLDPLSPGTHALRGRFLLAAGKPCEARACLRRALELDVELFGVHATLLDSSPTVDDKREALDFIHGLLVCKSFVGGGILAYRAAAYPILEKQYLQDQLDAILGARPDLWQAWSAVVWQHADVGRLDHAHHHAKAAAERFPLLPSVWLDLAAIEKLRGDDPAEVAALERTLRIRSANGEASRQLAAAHCRAGRFAEARLVLEQAIAAAPLDAANRGALAETLWKEDRKAHGAQVLEILADALRREPGYTWAWSALERYSRHLGQPALTERIARLLTTTRPGEARSWMRLAQTLDGITAPILAERLAALERALALNPRLADAYDLRAHLLVEAGRYEEALGACQPTAEAFPGNTRPFILDGRAAWVLASRGDLDTARARMRQVLADHPGYKWGWQMLANWAETAKDTEEALTAAERLAYLSPHDATPLGYLAAARLALGLRAGAKAALQEAMRRNPGYLYAPATLLNVQIEDKEFEAAEETLRFLEKHHPGPDALGRAVYLAAKRGDRLRAGAALGELAQLRTAPGTDRDDLAAAVKSMMDANWHGDAEAALRRAMNAPDTANPDAGALWVRIRTDRKKWRDVGKTVRRLPEGELARRARIAYLGALGERRWAGEVRAFIRRMRGPLRADSPSWGKAGFALTRCNLHRTSIRWLSDWASRPDAEAWMVFNLSICLRALGRHKAAVDVNRRALTLPPDDTRPRHAAWVALEDALTDGEEARLRATRLSAEIAPKMASQPASFKYLHTLAGQILAVRAAGDRTQRRAAYVTALKTVRTERRPLAASFRSSNQSVYHAERRARRRLAKDAGAWWDRVMLFAFSPPVSKGGQVVFVTVWIILGVIIASGAAVALISRESQTGR